MDCFLLFPEHQVGLLSWLRSWCAMAMSDEAQALGVRLTVLARGPLQQAPEDISDSTSVEEAEVKGRVV